MEAAKKMRHTPGEAVKIVLDADRKRINLKNEFGERYEVDLHDHDTGTSLRVTARLGDEKLLVWEYHHWKSQSYEFNNNDKILGLQVDGPWADEIDDILNSLETQTRNKIAAEEQAKRELERAKERAYMEKVQRFRDAFATVGAA